MEKQFKAECPNCYRENSFNLTIEEVKNDYDMSCDYCGKQYPISRWQAQEKENPLIKVPLTEQELWDLISGENRLVWIDYKGETIKLELGLYSGETS